MRTRHEVRKIRGGLFIGPKTVLEGLDPVMAPVFSVAQYCFAEAGGYNCWVTSAVRDDPDSWHGYGRGLDFDADVPLSPDVFTHIKEAMEERLGQLFYVLFHEGHIHVEHDPGGLGLKVWLANGWKHDASKEGYEEVIATRDKTETASERAQRVTAE